MLDDGSMQRRFRLVRPMQHDTISVEDFVSSHWKEAEEAEFSEVWRAEVANVPDFSTSTFHLVTGLLLPIWRRLPESNARVYRLQTDDGERVIGRMLSQVEMERSEEHTSELQSLMRISYAVFCLKKKTQT